MHTSETSVVGGGEAQPSPLTRAELAALVAILETRYGWHHPLTQRLHAHYTWQTSHDTPSTRSTP